MPPPPAPDCHYFRAIATLAAACRFRFSLFSPCLPLRAADAAIRHYYASFAITLTLRLFRADAMTLPMPPTFRHEPLLLHY